MLNEWMNEGTNEVTNDKLTNTLLIFSDSCHKYKMEYNI